MESPGIQLPDNYWFEGQVASWEGQRYGYRALFEVILHTEDFREIVNSAGDDELMELYEPGPDHELVITFVDGDDQPTDTDKVVLNQNNPAVIIPEGSRFILDATRSEGPVAYTCVIYGEKPLVEPWTSTATDC